MGAMGEQPGAFWIDVVTALERSVPSQQNPHQTPPQRSRETRFRVAHPHAHRVDAISTENAAAAQKAAEQRVFALPEIEL